MFKNMDKFSKSQLPKLDSLEFNQVTVNQLPKIEFPKLKTLSIYYCQVTSFAAFNESIFPSLEGLYISSLTVVSS